jgi:hypothetical protein
VTIQASEAVFVQCFTYVLDRGYIALISCVTLLQRKHLRFVTTFQFLYCHPNTRQRRRNTFCATGARYPLVFAAFIDARLCDFPLFRMAPRDPLPNDVTPLYANKKRPIGTAKAIEPFWRHLSPSLPQRPAGSTASSRITTKNSSATRSADG